LADIALTVRGGEAGVKWNARRAAIRRFARGGADGEPAGQANEIIARHGCGSIDRR